MVDRGCLDMEKGMSYVDNRVRTAAPMEVIRNLSSSFVPCKMDVICSRGTGFYNHPGNMVLRQLIEQNLERYSRSPSKLNKTIIVSEIIETMRERSSSKYGFVRKIKSTGVWQAVSDKLAREKVGQGFRAALKRGPPSKTAQAIDKCQESCVEIPQFPAAAPRHQDTTTAATPAIPCRFTTLPTHTATTSSTEPEANAKDTAAHTRKVRQVSGVFRRPLHSSDCETSDSSEGQETEDKAQRVFFVCEDTFEPLALDDTTSAPIDMFGILSNLNIETQHCNDDGKRDNDAPNPNPEEPLNLDPLHNLSF